VPVLAQTDLPGDEAVALYITKRHMEGGSGHEHIARVTWENRQTGEGGDSSRAEMVSFIEGDGDARVANGSSYVKVGVVDGRPKYIRTYADGKWTDNLLALPTY
jgi:hypothetical protein